MEINKIAMGQRIRTIRKDKNISSEALAEKLDIAVESLWHIENGARNTSLGTLLKIAVELDVSLDYLVGRTESPVAAIADATAAKHGLTEAQAIMLRDLCESMIPIIKNKV